MAKYIKKNRRREKSDTGLGRIRKSFGITQLELGIRMGYKPKSGQQMVAHIENGKFAPNLRQLERYARGLGCRLKLQFIRLNTKSNPSI